MAFNPFEALKHMEESMGESMTMFRNFKGEAKPELLGFDDTSMLRFKDQDFKELTTLKFLQDHFIQTGSTVFGYRDGSETDIDFLVGPSVNMIAWPILNSFETTREPYNLKQLYSYYFYLKTGEKINFLILKDQKVYNAYIDATCRMVHIRLMDNTSFDYCLKIKKNRCIMFQAFVKMYLNGE